MSRFTVHSGLWLWVLFCCRRIAFAIWLLCLFLLVIMVKQFVYMFVCVFYCLFLCLYCSVQSVTVVVASDFWSQFEVAYLVNLLTRKGPLLLTYWTHPWSGFLRVWNLQCLVIWTLRFSDVPNLLRSACFKASCLPSLEYWLFIRVSLVTDFGMLTLKRAYMLVVVFK